MFIDITDAEKEFIKYTNEFDHNDNKITRKISHSLRVKKISREIAETIFDNKEEIDLAELIGLLHDIGRFEQAKQTNCFKDSILDHADIGEEILKKDLYIRKFAQSEECDSVILKAIRNHNKFKIEDGLNTQELIHSKIIRDADKLDILYLYSEMDDFSYLVEGKNPNDDRVSEKVLEAFFDGRQLNKQELEYFLDHYINTISFIFDLNEKYSFQYLKDKNYMNVIIDKIEKVTESRSDVFEEIRSFTNNYLEEKSK